MNDKQSELQVSQAEMTEARLRLKRAREAVGRTPEDLRQFVGGSKSSYYDLEDHDGDLFMTIGLGELSRLCCALGIKPQDLFDNRKNAAQPILPEQLISRARDYMAAHKLSVPEFEEQIGFEIQPVLKDISKVLDWNIDFLRWLCATLDLDWRSVSYESIFKNSVAADVNLRKLKSNKSNGAN